MNIEQWTVVTTS